LTVERFAMVMSTELSSDFAGPAACEHGGYR
jgi:hypothetical protein